MRRERGDDVGVEKGMEREEANPYAPPSGGVTKADMRAGGDERVDRILRWVGAGCWGYLLVAGIFSGLQGSGIQMAGRLIGMMMAGVCVMGFLSRGRMAYLGVALISGLYLGLMGYAISEAWDGMTAQEWVDVASVALPTGVAGVCGLVLFLRADRRWRMQGPEERKKSRGGAAGGQRGEAVARVIRERAMERFGLKEADLGRALVGDLRWSPGEVGDFVAEMDEDLGTRLEDEVNVRTVSVEEMMGVGR